VFTVIVSSQTLSILHVLAPAEVGGLETVVLNLTAEQQRRGHAVAIAAVVAPDRAEHPFVRSMAQTGIPVYPIEVATRAYLHERRAIQRLCLRIGPNVLHTHGFRPDVLDGPVAHRIGAASVSTVHGFLAGTWRGRIYEWLQERSYRRFDAVVAVSRLIGSRLVDSGVRADRVHVVPNAIRFSEHGTRNDARRELDLPDDAFIIGWIGRLSHEKGPDVMLRALKELETDVRLCVLGSGRDADALRRLTSMLDIEHRVYWRGVIPNAKRVLSAFDVIALTSRTEGTPMVLLEAMNALIPVIATKVGGIPDVISEREGSLVPPEDPQAVAQAVRDVRSDPFAAMQRALTANRRLENQYNVASWADQYDQVYRRALQRLQR
jgi:glycosyltransferase involved in cell wall biosynthesis